MITLPSAVIEKFVEAVVATVDDAVAENPPVESPEKLGRRIALMAYEDLSASGEAPEVVARRVCALALR